MRIAICGDLHYSNSSSLIKGIGDLYPLRLENCIQTINWFEKTAIENNCDVEVFLGDFFDKPDLKAKEITALKEIQWNDLDKTFLIGNHEAFGQDLYFNSTNVLASRGFDLVKDVTLKDTEDAVFLLIPYLLPENMHTLKEYFEGVTFDKPRIVFSHNDIKGVQYGPVVSKEGFEISDIDANCDMFINGHIHNTGYFGEVGFNIGNITGQNFNEDAFLYPHQMCILDTVQHTLEKIENPYAFNIYQVSIMEEKDLDILDKVKNNAVLSIKCHESLLTKLNEKLDTMADKIVVKRILTVFDTVVEGEENKIETLQMNHLEKFVEFVHDRIGSNAIVDEELSFIC